uniref:Replication-associated protein n=1 Tax=Rodent circovirus TaxID=2050016 RepID=A0A2H4MWX0_9CIRC|nr:Rep [Rodent circovirus]
MRARNYCITAFRPISRDQLEEMLEEREYGYIVVGEEVAPRTGKRHWHMYVELLEPKSMNQVKEMFGMNDLHVEVRKGSGKEAAEYVKKDGNWYELGEMKQQGKRNDLEDIHRMLKDGMSLLEVAEQHFGDFVRYHRGFALYADLLARKKQKEREPVRPDVIVYLGPAGAGKSHNCYNYPGYKTDGYKYLCQADNKVYFDGYEGESIIWFDEFRGSVLPFSLFLQLTDKWGCRVEYKGGSIEIFAKTILISTVEWPTTWWAGSRKFTADPNQLWRRITNIFYVPARGREPITLDIQKVAKYQSFDEYKHYEPSESDRFVEETE